MSLNVSEFNGGRGSISLTGFPSLEGVPLLHAHLCHHLLSALIQDVFAHVHQLSEENLADLEEPSAGGPHQGL